MKISLGNGLSRAKNGAYQRWVYCVQTGVTYESPKIAWLNISEATPSSIINNANGCAKPPNGYQFEWYDIDKHPLPSNPLASNRAEKPAA